MQKEKRREFSEVEIGKIKQILSTKNISYREKVENIIPITQLSFRATRYLLEDKLKLHATNNSSTFKRLTEEDKKIITDTYWDKSKSWTERIHILTTKFNMSERNLRRICSQDLKITKKETVDAPCEQLDLAKDKSFDKNKKRFLITCAQNATDINNELIENMEAYATEIDGEILVIPIRYHNPGSIISENDKKQNWWDSDIVKYLTLQRHNLNDNVSVLSDVKVQPTATMPLNGFEGLVGSGSAIIAHPRVHMKSLPILSGQPKMLFTTGSCTKPNYTDSKAGKLGEFHHSYGFVIVEIQDDEIYYIRQVIAKKDGSFNDLYFNVEDGVVTRNTSVAALIKGDIHYGNHNKAVFDRCFNELVPKLKPNNILLHDIFDGYSINPHEEKNWVMNYKKSISGEDNLTNEIDNLIKWLDSIKHLNIVVVFSNHDDFLNRFILNSNPLKLVNPGNALAFVEYAKILLSGEAPNGLLAYAINKAVPEIKCLGRNDSFVIKGWELGAHGMDGANGAKGGIKQFKMLNTHIVTAHGHGVFRYDGAMQTGTNSEYKLSYNNGMSSWVHSDVIIHDDKKAQHIFYLGPNKEFTTFK